MNEKIILVDREKLEQIIDRLELDKEKRQNENIKARWLNYVLWWDSRAREARRKYFGLRSAVVIGGALIPALVGLRELNAWSDQSWIFSVASVLASLVVAICAGLESLFAFGDIWREKRAAAELIKTEGFRFFELAGDYQKRSKTHADLYPIFADRVEDIIASEIKDYIISVKPKGEGK
jgi:hypothetical protein